ncbi:MAG: WD40 repeat domain-containing protein [Treponema sp.]|nr:WD40 repeat domain-containing protein [Treponema sp.]
MAKTRKKYWLSLGILFFVLYFFIAAQPIPKETILVPRWIASLESGYPVSIKNNPEASTVIPFRLGNRFGYINDSGQFILNRTLQAGYLSFSPDCWAEYNAVPSNIDVYNPDNLLLMSIDNPGGYPLFMDNRVYLVGNEQNSISSLDDQGNVRWTYDFPAPLTCIDASGGFVLAGTLDGAIELLNDSGTSVYSTEPGGSRLAVILGCAVSADGSKLAVISGIDQQRFLLMEQSGNTYRVVYHEFLDSGFRRAVHINFIDNDSKVAYECEGGIGIYDMATRKSVRADLEGEITTLGSTDSKYLFIITSLAGNQKRLYMIRMPGIIFLDAPFRSENSFLFEQDNRIYTGTDKSIVSFETGKK